MMGFDFIREWSWLIGLIVSIASPIISIFVEYKYHIINKINKRLAILKNKQAKLELYFECKADVPFETLKINVKNKFGTYNNFKVFVDKETRLIFNSDIYSMTINLIDYSPTQIAISIDRIACGINDLVSIIGDIEDKFFSLSDKEDENKTLSDINNFSATLSLPYKWENFKIKTPKNFQIKNYDINMIHKDNTYNSEITVRMESIRIDSNSWKSLSNVIKQLI